MTLLDRSPVETPAPETPRRARRAVVALAVLALAAGAVVGGTAARDAAVLSQVHVFLAGTPITCADPSDMTSVLRGGETSDDRYPVPSVKGVLGLDCTLSVVVQNDSDDDVAVQRVLFPLTGPESAVGLHVDRSFTQDLTPSPAGDRSDVLFGSPHPLDVAAHGVQVLRFHLGSDGCRQAGATTTFDDAPVVTLSTGLLTVDAARQGVGFGFVGARTSAQPCR